MTDRPAQRAEPGNTANNLGVTVESLARLGVTRTGREWHIPERNADGEIIGTAIRNDDGRKWFVEGGHRGLTMAWPIDPYAGSSPNAPIIVVEGMSDTATGLDLGYVTIGRPSACGGLDHLLALLKDRHVVIVGENDATAGYLGAGRIADGLLVACETVRVIYPPTGVKDLRTWHAAGCDHDKLEAAIANAPLHDDDDHNDGDQGLIVRCASAIEMREVDWLWRPLLVAGGINMWCGMPDVGKGVAACDLAARVSKGRPWPPVNGEAVQNERGTVAILSMEDSPETTIVPRLKAAGADLDPILLIEGVYRVGAGGEKIRDAFDIASDVARLEALRVENPDLRLVIIDPLDSYISAKVDTNIGNKARAALWPLKTWAEDTGVAVLIIHHFNKSVTTNALDKVSGARSFGALPRSVWAIGRDEGGHTVLAPVKMNLVRDNEKKSIAFTIESSQYNPDVPTVCWLEGDADITASELLGERSSKRRDEAANWLRDILADGPMDSRVLLEHANQAGHAEATIRRAKDGVGVVVTQRRSGDGKLIEGWTWALPPSRVH